MFGGEQQTVLERGESGGGGTCGAAVGLWGLHGGFLEGGFMVGFVVASGGLRGGIQGGFMVAS